jgi:uncharacterized membrane protein
MDSIVSFLDGFSVALVIVLWSYTILNFRKLPEIIPIHFDLEGKPDNYGAKYFIFFLPIIGSLIYFFLSFNIKEINNYPVEITQENKEIQFFIGMMAVKSIIAYVLFIFFTFQKRIVEIAVQQKDKKIPVISLIGGLFGIIVFFIILANIYK